MYAGIAHSSSYHSAHGVVDSVISFLSNYAYERGSSEYSKLSQEVFRWTGKPVDGFPGTYRGETFMVGGR